MWSVLTSEFFVVMVLTDDSQCTVMWTVNSTLFGEGHLLLLSIAAVRPIISVILDRFLVIGWYQLSVSHSLLMKTLL